MEVCELLRRVELVLDADLSVRHGGDDGPRVLDEGGSDGRLVWRHRGECHCRPSPLRVVNELAPSVVSALRTD